MPRCDTCGTETEEKFLTEDVEFYDGYLCPTCLRSALATAEKAFHSAMNNYFAFRDAVDTIDKKENEQNA